MAEQDAIRQMRLECERATYRYITALESGDSAAMAALWHEAEHNAILEQMLWDALDAFQHEEQVFVHPEEIPSLQNLLDTLFDAQDDGLPEIIQDASPTPNTVATHVPVSAEVQRDTRERLEHTMNTVTTPSFIYPHAVEAPFRQRLSALLQSSVTVLVVGAMILGFLFLFTAHHLKPNGFGPLVSHVNGTWGIVPSPNPGTSQNILESTVALTPKDAWAVGYQTSENSNAQQILLEHWNGTRWGVVPGPNPGKSSNTLYGVAALSSNNVWAVGSASDSYDGSTGSALIEHWDGSQWSVVNSPKPEKGVANLYAVSARSANDIWAVGIVITNSSPQAGQTLTEHWNGTQWSIVPSPSVLTNDYLNSVVAISVNDVWAVGISSPSSNPQGALTLTEHWNGRQWNVVKSPNPGSNDTLSSVVAVSPNDVWTLGYFENAQHTYQTLTAHWNGTQWSIVKSANPDTKLNVLNAATVIAANDIWAVGYASNSDANHAQTLIEHWNGFQWSVVKNPNPPGEGNNNWFFAVAAVPSSSTIWAVGFSATSGFSQAQTLIERYS